MKLKKSDLKQLRDDLVHKQTYLCDVCNCDFKEGYYHRKLRDVVPKHMPCLDHDHKTGQIRGVLCRGCNSLEGRIVNSIERWHTSVDNNPREVSALLHLLAEYTEHHAVDRNEGLIHPDFKNDEEKRLLKNKKARNKRKNSQK